MLGFGEENDEVNELLPQIGAILAGRRTYNVGAVEKRPQFRKPYGGAVLIHTVPVLLGDGVRLFSRQGADEVHLELVRVTRAVQLTNLRFAYVG